MPTYYNLREISPGTWNLSSYDYTPPPPDDDGPGTIDNEADLGNYKTPPLALADHGVSVNSFMTGLNAGRNGIFLWSRFARAPVVYRASTPSLAYNPLADVDWESFPPSYRGVTFPEVERKEMRRYLVGDFTGFNLQCKVEASGSQTPKNGNGGTSTANGTSEIDFAFTRDDALRASRGWHFRDTTKVGDDAALDTRLYDPYDPNHFPEPVDTEISKSTFTSPGAGGKPVSSQVQLVGDNPTFKLAFLRGSDDTTCRLYFWARMQGSANAPSLTLYAYAPVDGADYWDVYGINHALPAANDYYKATEIDEDGPKILGVQTKLWGYSAESKSPSTTGSFLYVPKLEIDEQDPDE